MAASSSDLVDAVQLRARLRSIEPDWLETFVESEYHAPCHDHPDVHGNKKIYYCMDCKIPACKYCVSSNRHQRHKFIRVNKSKDMNIVSLEFFQKLINCGGIQPFYSNRKMVVALSRPPSVMIFRDELACAFCRRKLSDPDNFIYCSIKCKMEAYKIKRTHSDEPFLAIEEHAESCGSSDTIVVPH